LTDRPSSALGGLTEDHPEPMTIGRTPADLAADGWASVMRDGHERPFPPGRGSKGVWGMEDSPMEKDALLPQAKVRRRAAI